MKSMKEQKIMVKAPIKALATKKGATTDRRSIPIVTKGIILRTNNKSNMTLVDMTIVSGKNTAFNVKIMKYMVVTRTMAIALRLTRGTATVAGKVPATAMKAMGKMKIITARNSMEKKTIAAGQATVKMIAEAKLMMTEMSIEKMNTKYQTTQIKISLKLIFSG